MEVMRSPGTVVPYKESEVEGATGAQTKSPKDNCYPCAEMSMPPVPKLPRDSVATDQAQWHSEWHFWYQKITEILIHKLPLQRLLQETGQSIRMDIRFPGDCHGSPTRIQPKLTSSDYLRTPNLYVIHAKRVMVLPRDIQLAHRIHGERF